MIDIETAIPKYPFEQDEATGNPHFRINKNDSVVNYKKADFLIPHRKDYYFMAFVKEGRGRHWIDMTPYYLQPDVFYFSVPHQVHLKEEIAPISGYTIGFTEEFLSLYDDGFLAELPLLRNPYNGHELLLNKEEIAFTESLLDQLAAEYQRPDHWQQPMLLSCLKMLLIYLSRIYMTQYSEASQLPEKMILKNFLARINESYRNVHDVTGYAEMLHLSAGHLSDVVKQQSGKPAIEHIHQRIVMEARRLLFRTELAVKEIAWELGFEDASYFNRFFKRMAGDTPVNWRKSVREKYH